MRIYLYIHIYIYIYIYIAYVSQLADASYTQSLGYGFKPRADN